MNKGTIIVLVLAAALLAYLALRDDGGPETPSPHTVAGYLSESDQAEYTHRKEEPLAYLAAQGDGGEKKFPDPPYDEIQITRKGVTVTMIKEGEDDWKMTSPVESVVEGYRVKNILELFATDIALNPAQTLKDPTQLVDFGLDERRAITLVLKQGGVTKAHLVIGNALKVRGGGDTQQREVFETFVLMGDDKAQVYRAKLKDLRQPLDFDVGELRSKKVFGFDISHIDQITLENPGQPKIVVGATWTQPPKPEGAAEEDDAPKPEGTYALVEPKMDGFRLMEMRRYWSSLANLRATEFRMGDKPTPAMELTGDPAKTPRITISYRDGEEAKTAVLWIGGVAERDKTLYAMVEGRDEVMLVGKHTQTNLVKTLAQLRDPAMLGMTEDDQLTRIEITNEHTAGAPDAEGPQSMVLVKSATGWTMESPAGITVSDKEVKGLVSGIRHFKATEYLDAAPDSAESGLDAPTVTLKVTISGVEKTVVFGAERDSKVTAHLVGTDLYFKIGSFTRNKFTKAPVELRNKALLGVASAEDVTGLRLVHGGGETVELSRVPGQAAAWTMTAPEQLTGASGLNDQTVTHIANALKGFEVKGFTDKTVEGVGLATPAFTLVATLKDGSTREVRISDTKEGTDHLISLVAPGVDPNAVFTLTGARASSLRKKVADLRKE